MTAAKTRAGTLPDDLWEAVSTGDEYTATDIVMAALDDGMEPEEVLLDVIAPLQARVGREWAANRISVAQEHTATAVNERVLGAVAHHPAVRRRQQEQAPEHPGRIAVACIDGEWHALPARLVAEVLRLRGWQVDYLGAQVPTPHLISHLHLTGPAVVALSSSIATRLPAAHAAITACQSTGTPVLVGGAAFGHDGRYAALLGADAWAPDARAAADRLARGPLPKPPPVHRVIDDLPHLADRTYAHVTRAAPQLIRHVMGELDSRYPAMAEYTDQQRSRTAEDVAHIVEFLGTALYLDDPDLLTEFIGWTAGILTVRGVPAVSLLPALDLLSEQLTEHPRAALMLERARDAVREPPPGSLHDPALDTA
ncbi:cobalamin B12-binding domain-containing protein [Actinomadura livida]|uniref:Cobalamin B12-binding domain-containing protein n=1 Tax=Actinomadura livida TaxID=79909 RepID=A0A7W7MWC0_9ACTN|nr:MULTISPECIES: cobalamin B12-binding domain-containing protein [Actinomadura]MBB4773571.1 methanogenic corrinoid protein MtbC1 [Actinomadura catellatispora]GGU09242.1 cobalamin-binding protein [Actinomadura livida]